MKCGWRSRNRENRLFLPQARLICSATGLLKIILSYPVLDIFNPNRHLPHPPTSERCSDFQKSSVIVDHPLVRWSGLIFFHSDQLLFSHLYEKWKSAATVVYRTSSQISSTTRSHAPWWIGLSLSLLAILSSWFRFAILFFFFKDVEGVSKCWLLFLKF